MYLDTLANYSKWEEYLNAKHDSFKIEFKEIEKIIGKLPPSAYKYKEWWNNHPSHPLMKVSLKNGWRQRNLDLFLKKVGFYQTKKINPKYAAAAIIGDNPSLYFSPTTAITKTNEAEETSFDRRQTGAEWIEKSERSFKIQRNKQLKQQTPDFTVDGKDIYFEHILDDFASQIAKGKTEIYNEASIQYELAIFLREVIPNYKIQLERNVSYFELNKKHFLKREIDIVLFNTTKTRKFAIEIKTPMSGNYPMEMFYFCQDIKFLEQLKESGFTDNFFLAITPRSNFWGDRGKTGTIYEKFRKEKELYGTIKNQIGDSKEEVTLKGRHKINWLTINDSTRYFVMRV